MATLFTTDTLSEKRNKQKMVYQETYDDCSFAFEFVPMNSKQVFNKQAILEAYIEVDGFEKVDAVGILDVSYSKIDQFNRLFYFISDDADPSSIHNMSSLENIKYGILGDNGINPFNVSDKQFAFSDSKIKAGYANPAPNYANNTHLRHDYIRYTAKAITGGYALSDVFSNEPDLIKAVGDLDEPFNLDFAKRINDLSGCILKGSDDPGYKTSKSLVTGLLDLSNEPDQTTTRFKRGTQFLRDLAEQSIHTFESEKNVSQGEFWVKFHPGDAIAVRLTYNPENGNGNPAKNSLGFLGENKLNDRSYKIYLKFNRATFDEATQGILSEFMNIVTYRNEADNAIGEKTVFMPTLLSDSLNTMTHAKEAIVKSFDKVLDLKDQPPTPIVLAGENFTNASSASIVVSRAEEQLKVALGSIGNIKLELENASSQLNNASIYTKNIEFPSVYIKTDALKGIMTNVADSVKNVAHIANAKNNLTNVSNIIPKTYDVLDTTKTYAERRVNEFIVSLDSYAANMSGMISVLNTSAGVDLSNASTRMDGNMSTITTEKKNAYKEFVAASVAQNASVSRGHARLANEHSAVVEELNDAVLNDYNKTLSVVESVTNVSRKLRSLSSVLVTLQTGVANTSGYADVSNPPQTVVSSLNASINLTTLIATSVLDQYSNTATKRNLDSKLKNMQSIYHAANAKRVADMWVTNEEVARSEAAKVNASTAAKYAVLSDASANLVTTTSIHEFAVETEHNASRVYHTAFTNASNMSTYLNGAIVRYTNANTSLDTANASYTKAYNDKTNANASLSVANASVGLATNKYQGLLRDESGALEKYNRLQSTADVLRETADTMALIAAKPEATDYEKQTSAAATAESATATEAARLAAVYLQEYRDPTGLKSVSLAKSELDAETALRDAEISKVTANSTAFDKAKKDQEDAKTAFDQAKTDQSKAETDLADARSALTAAKGVHDKAKEDLSNAATKKGIAEGVRDDALDLYEYFDAVDEINADRLALVAGFSDASVVGAANAELAVAAEKCNAEITISGNTYTIKVTLSDDFARLTKTAFSAGVFSLDKFSGLPVTTYDLSGNLLTFTQSVEFMSGTSFPVPSLVQVQFHKSSARSDSDLMRGKIISLYDKAKLSP